MYIYICCIYMLFLIWPYIYIYIWRYRATNNIICPSPLLFRSYCSSSAAQKHLSNHESPVKGLPAHLALSAATRCFLICLSSGSSCLLYLVAHTLHCPARAGGNPRCRAIFGLIWLTKMQLLNISAMVNINLYVYIITAYTYVYICSHST